MREVNFKISVAIDFGTDGCGLAFAFNDEVDIYSKWKSKRKITKFKAKTHILLNDKNEVESFGDNAKTTLMSISYISKGTSILRSVILTDT